MLNVLRRSAARRKTAEALSAAIAVRARAPEFFRDWGVADSFNGRFDMLTLHAWLVLERLREAGYGDLSQALVNALFASFEEALREQGAGDIGMSRRLKKIANAFYGRLGVYGRAASPAELAAALLRNVFGGEPEKASDAERLAEYAMLARARLASAQLAEGRLDFGPLGASEAEVPAP